MKYEHKAIIDAAIREGKTPAELAKELLGHDLLKSMVTIISKPAVAFSKMSQQQQQGVIDDMTKDLLPAIGIAIGVIVSQNTRAVRMKLKKLATGPSLQLTGTLDKSQDHIHELMDLASDNSDVLIIMHERDYVQALDAIQGEKDQKALPLDGGKDPKPKAACGTGAKKAGDIAAKVIELPPALIEQAEAFVRNIQTATHAGIQNQFKINFDKAEALLQALQERGVVTEKDEQGNRTLVRVKAEPAATVATEDKPVEQIHSPEKADLSNADLYEQAKAKVIADQEVSAGGLAVAFDLTDERAATLMDELEMQGVISEASDLGTREVLMTNQVH